MTLEDKIKNGKYENIQPNGLDEVNEVEALSKEVKEMMDNKD